MNFTKESDSEMTKKSIWILISIGLVMLLGLAACDSGGFGPGGGNSNQQGDTNPAQAAPPAPYAGRTNPKASDANAAAQGKELYAINCASCHGASGKGDGPTAAALEPKPKPLAQTLQTAGDDYIYWRIAEGGAFPPFNSAMPAWKATLKEEQIWSIVSFLRTLR